MKTGIFGGSFNPVHLGHVGIARKAIDELELDRLIVLPAAESPFKPGSSAVKTPWDRLESVKDAFSAVDKVLVDDRELRRSGVSYAIDSVREISAENPGDELYFIAGEDCRESLHQWKDYDDLVRLCTFVFFPRTAESSSAIRESFIAAGVVENPDARIARTIRDGLRRKNGYCPCRLQKTPENFCPCGEFLGQITDGSFHGFCHCRLYLKP